MTRDCSIEELAYESQSGGKIVKLSDLQDWLTDKKVIKKGLQPHPYADVLHAWLEGTEIEWHSEDLDKNKATKNIWYSVEGGLTLRTPFSSYVKYRIKPSEPVKKYRYAYLDYDGTPSISEHMTEGYASTNIVNRTKATRLDWSVIDE